MKMSELSPSYTNSSSFTRESKEALLKKKDVWSIESRDMIGDSLSTHDDISWGSLNIDPYKNKRYNINPSNGRLIEDAHPAVHSSLTTSTSSNLISPFDSRHKPRGNVPPILPSPSLNSTSSLEQTPSSPFFCASNKKSNMKNTTMILPDIPRLQSNKTRLEMAKTSKNDVDDHVQQKRCPVDMFDHSTSIENDEILKWATVAASASMSVFNGGGSRDLAKIVTETVLSTEIEKGFNNLVSIAAEACTAVLAAGGSHKSAVNAMVMIMTNYEVCGGIMGGSNITNPLLRNEEREYYGDRCSIVKHEHRDGTDYYNTKEYSTNTAPQQTSATGEYHEKVSNGIYYKIDDHQEVCRGCAVSIPTVTPIVRKISNAIEDTGISITRSLSRVMKKRSAKASKAATKATSSSRSIVRRSRSNPETTSTPSHLKPSQILDKREMSDPWRGVKSLMSPSSDEEDDESERNVSQRSGMGLALFNIRRLPEPSDDDDDDDDDDAVEMTLDDIHDLVLSGTSSNDGTRDEATLNNSQTTSSDERQFNTFYETTEVNDQGRIMYSLNTNEAQVSPNSSYMNDLSADDIIDDLRVLENVKCERATMAVGESTIEFHDSCLVGDNEGQIAMNLIDSRILQESNDHRSQKASDSVEGAMSNNIRKITTDSSARENVHGGMKLKYILNNEETRSRSTFSNEYRAAEESKDGFCPSNTDDDTAPDYSAFLNDSLSQDINAKRMLTNNGDNEIAMMVSNLTSDYYDSCHGGLTEQEEEHEKEERPPCSMTSVEEEEEEEDMTTFGSSHNIVNMTTKNGLYVSLDQIKSSKNRGSSFHRVKRKVGKKLGKLVSSDKKSSKRSTISPDECEI